MKRTLAFLSLTLLSMASYASPIIGTGSFTNFGINPNNDGVPFWDRVSSDGGSCNVGFVLAGSSLDCGNKRLGTTDGQGIGSSNLDYYAFSEGNTTFSLAAGSYSLSLLSSITAASVYEVGYSIGGVDTTIFSSGSNVVGDVFSFTAASDFSLYIKSDGNTFRSTGPDGVLAAAFRDNTGNYYFGFEDRQNGDFDYNDVVVSFAQQSEVPEPSTYLILASGLFALGILKKRA